MARIEASSSETSPGDEDPVYGDILEEVLSHVPLLDLIPALQVSRSWNDAVHSSLRCRNPPKPWLILHTQAAVYPYAAISTHAYDPRSHLWIKISPQPPSTEKEKNHPPLPLRSSNSNFIYMFPPSINLSFSFDPLNPTWHQAGSASICRLDPIVARVGDSIIVAGGAYDFEDEALAVEIYDTKLKEWRKSEPMPEDLKVSSYSNRLSVAAATDDEKLYVMNKKTGVSYYFELKFNRWSTSINLRPDPRCFYSVMGRVDDDGRLIVVGLIRDVDRKVESVRIWEVSFDHTCREIGEMPSALFRKLKGESSTDGVISSIDICLGGKFVYIYRPEDVAELVVCEVVNGGACNWGSLKNPVAEKGRLTDTVVVTCADVKLEELQRGLKVSSRKFEYVNV